MTHTAEQALQALLSSEYASLQSLFGDVLTKRSKQRDSDCFIFRLLARDQTDDLRRLEKDCAVYIHELGLENAKQKSKGEIGGVFKRPTREFNARLADFWAEMDAIRVLSEDNFHEFALIQKDEHDGATNDYRALHEQVPAYVEVKNLHANETVLDVFIREIGRAYEADPPAYPLHLMIDYPYDHWPTGEQERIIRDFVQGIAGRKPPFRERLNLVDSVATIDVTAGAGNAHLCRGVGGDCPEAVDYNWLLKRVRSKAEEAKGQIPDGNRRKVLVVNVETTNAMLELEFVERAKQEIEDVFAGNVLAYVLHYGSRVQT